MFTLKSCAKRAIMLSCATVLFAVACHAVTIAYYSGQYTSDLEQKQAYLDTIKEDAARTEAEMKDNIEKAKATDKGQSSHLGLEDVKLAEMMPSPEKMNVAFTYMSHTLSPEPYIKTLDRENVRTRQ